jgi:hypothetical protein
MPIKALYEAFGGGLWFGERLCYQDGVEVLQLLKKLLSWETRWQLSWFEEKDDPLFKQFQQNDLWHLSTIDT